MFQSTRPHGARHDVLHYWRDLQRVSIHAPAWGATYIWEYDEVLPRVSIHAPAWGATRLLSLWGELKRVSIHAPAWGATTKRRRL
uniref:Uncharacterized protein n=1 Tax=uncultured Desulfobacterium sp. TaxID=201089 RepID=E1YE08_9BACT|nr:hypothetical protein N47_B20840 [uncultured Desulfobacterium sp.]